MSLLFQVARVNEKSFFIAWANIEAIRRGELETSVNWQLSFCFSNALFANEELLGQVKHRALNPRYPVTLEGLMSQFAAVASHDRRRQLRSIRSPTLVLGAREDGIIDVGQIEALAREIEHAELRLLPGGHMYHIEYPHTFAEALIKFVGHRAYFQAA